MSILKKSRKVKFFKGTLALVLPFLIVSSISDSQVAQASLRSLSPSVVKHSVNLTISYSPNKKIAKPLSYTVRCSGVQTRIVATGSHPNKDAICKFLFTQSSYTSQTNVLFKKFPQNMMCTQIYGSDEIGTAKGYFDGKPVDTDFSRENGCAIARWESAKVLFTFPGNQVITGNISVSPTCLGPVKVDGNHTDCVKPSVDGITFFTSQASGRIKSKTLRASAVQDQGYVILLSYGNWNVSAQSKSAMSCSRSTVTIPISSNQIAVGEPNPNGIIHSAIIDISCDTGMR